MSDDIWEVYAVRYAEHQRKAAENYIGGDPHDVLQPLDYFVWVIKNDKRTFLVDTGFDQPVGTQARPHHHHADRRGAEAARHRSRQGRGHHHQPHALRPLRQRRYVPARPLPRAGQGDALLHRPLHVPQAAPQLVRRRLRRLDAAQGVRRPRHVPRRRRARWRRASRCTTSAATPWDCRASASRPSAAT